MIRLLSLLALSFGSFFSCFSQNNLVTYAGSSGKDGFYDVTQLSDGTFLVSGYAESLSWVNPNVPMIALSYSGNIPNSLGTNRFGYLLHFSSDMQSLLHVVHFAQGVVEDIRFIKANAIPYQSTGDLFISCNTSDTYDNDGGYIIAKLNNNFVNGVPTAIDWHQIVWAESYAKDFHPWDVTASGEVYYVSGAAHGYDWSAMYKLNNQGQRTIVENWRTHWLTEGGEWHGAPASAYPGGGAGAVNFSGIAFKIWGRCELRSWTQQDFDAIYPDGNGGTKKGTWPADILFSGPCDPENPTANGPGYTGYSAEACCPVWGASSVVVDRRNNKLYLGMNFKSYSTSSNSPDFEPAVIAFDSTGQMEWWSRLYHEITPEGNTMESLPDQYVDALAIDYTNDLLVVGGRTHGNNVENFWEGNSIAANPNAHGFQNQFTGTNGNIHESWIGKLQLSDGTLMASTYMAELAEGTGNLGTPHADPNLDGWPDPNTGWPDVNTTRMAKNALKVSSNGDVCVAAVGRRTITTANAYQKMVKPYFGGASSWNSFIRVYDTDLQIPKYSSLVVGAWDTLTQIGGSNTELFGIHKTAEGVVCVGRQTATEGQADGNDIPVVNVPNWGNSSPANESCILVYYKATNLYNPADGSVVTSVNPIQLSSQPRLSIFPNPASTQLYLSETAKEILVYNALGKLMLHVSNTNYISTQDLCNGIYIVFTDNQYHRLIIQR
jgi:hypothetical protein